MIWFSVVMIGLGAIALRIPSKIAHVIGVALALSGGIYLLRWAFDQIGGPQWLFVIGAIILVLSAAGYLFGIGGWLLKLLGAVAIIWALLAFWNLLAENTSAPIYLNEIWANIKETFGSINDEAGDVDPPVPTGDWSGPTG